MRSECKKIPINRRPGQWASRTSVWLLLISVIILVSACYPAPYRPAPRSMPQNSVGAPTPLPAQVYFYPRAGQTNEQQSRDHYECYNWAVDRTGFDPGQSSIPTDQRVRVVPMPPPGHDTATLAIAGAVLGALIGGPRHAAGGALIGATGGAIAGAASDSARQEYARQQEEAYAARDRASNARSDTKVIEFRRAMSACLEGRGYSVR
ncbi:MAG: glycine zipper family protein [Syntrophales bacterium]